MNLNDPRIKDILLQEDYLAEEDVKSAENYLKEHDGYTLVEYLLMEKLVTKKILAEAIAEFFKVQYSNLSVKQPSRDVVLQISEEKSREKRIVLTSINEEEAVLATDIPDKQNTEELKKFVNGRKVKLTYALPEEVDNIFVHYKKPLETRFLNIIQRQKEIAPEIIEAILDDAVTYHTSDIHFEPQEKEAVIRFRIDGMLREAGRIPKEHYEYILNRIKVQARLRIDEHFTPQDGAIRYSNAKGHLDMRVSITPTLDGEKVCVRLLASYVQNMTLEGLGLAPKDKDIIEKAAHKPFGMILVTGPTGSGKTTTLYTLLSILHSPDVNITTIEDPVEIKIVGVNQIQVNPQANLTFAQGLRSIVRQDPDIILVGEIRDRETVEIAVNAALTGHLLLSTFHANDAATAIPRLLDMGVEPFLLASTLEVIAAQRLVRKLCTACRYSVPLDMKEVRKILPSASNYFKKKQMSLYKAKGCETCNHIGYSGRLAIYEFIQITREMEDLILINPSTQQIWDLAKKQGSRSLFEDGLDKVKRGLTTLEELLRLAAPPDDTGNVPTYI